MEEIRNMDAKDARNLEVKKNGQRGGGTRPKFTVEQIIQALRDQGGFISGACRQLGADWSTIDRYRKKYPAIEQAIKEIKESQLDFAESKLLSKIKEGDLGAICFYLKCQGKHRGWVERQEITGKEGIPIIPIEYIRRKN